MKFLNAHDNERHLKSLRRLLDRADSPAAHTTRAEQKKRSLTPAIMAALRAAPRRVHRAFRLRLARRHLRKKIDATIVRNIEKSLVEVDRLRDALRQTHHEVEERVKERTRELERANAELQAFNHSVAHDLRNPLFGIMSSAQCLEIKYAQSLDADGRALLSYIKSSGNRMSAIITDLLKLSDVTHIPLRWEACDLSALVNQIGARLQQANAGHRVEFVVEPGIMANADPHLLAPALENLLSNAWKYTGKTCHARVEFGWEWKAGKAIYFVRDNGIGFDPGKAVNLFKPFVRLHSPSEFAGTGIGLSIAHRAIERHGGQIWAESKPDKGTTFFFRL